MFDVILKLLQTVFCIARTVNRQTSCEIVIVCVADIYITKNYLNKFIVLIIGKIGIIFVSTSRQPEVYSRLDRQ